MTREIAVVVLGGGPAGSTCARLLAQRGHAVCLVADQRHSAGPPFGESGGPALCRTFVNSGLLMPPESACPLPTFWSSWGEEELEGRTFALWQASDGCLLDRVAFDSWLREEARAAGVEIVQPGRGFGVQRQGDRWLLSGGHEGATAWRRSAQFVVEATGRVARSVFYPDTTRWYTDHLVCLSMDISGLAVADSGAVVEARPEGWWYAARSLSGRGLLAWFTDADQLPPPSARRPWFTTLLRTTRHLQDWLGPLPAHMPLRMWDARTSIRTVLWRGTWLPIGDAAWSLDPLSGSGVERAIQAGIAAAQGVAQALCLHTTEPLRALALAHLQAFQAMRTVQRSMYQRVTRFRAHPFWQRRVL